MVSSVEIERETVNSTDHKSLLPIRLRERNLHHDIPRHCCATTKILPTPAETKERKKKKKDEKKI